MPPTIMPDEGLIFQHMQSLQIPYTGSVPWRLMLWQNDLLPDYATVLAHLVECTFVGYGRITIDPTKWTGFTAIGGCSSAQWGLVPIVWEVLGFPPTSEMMMMSQKKVESGRMGVSFSDSPDGGIGFGGGVVEAESIKVYGWAMVDEIAGVIRRVQRFDDSNIQTVTVGSVFLLLPTVTFTSAEC